MKTITFDNKIISSKGPAYVIAEIGNNHQGDIETAIKMIEVAAASGADAVKFQKRDNKSLFVSAFYNKPYENENSYGATYGEHREFLEFGWDQYRQLKKCAEANNVDFMCTAFDFESVDFLEKLGISTYKVASADLTNIPLLTYIAKLGKPMIVSTGAATLEEIRLAHNAIMALNNQLSLLHCVAGYPVDYKDLNLRVIETLKQEFPDVVLGYSGHDNGILAPVLAYMLGAVIIEKHFTLNRSLKGTDHKFSLEPEGLRKMVRDLKRTDLSLGQQEKTVNDFELEPKKKMGKGIYASQPIAAGTVITAEHLVFKVPTNGTPPYVMDQIVGKRVTVDLTAEASFSLDIVQ